MMGKKFFVYPPLKENPSISWAKDKIILFLIQELQLVQDEFGT